LRRGMVLLFLGCFEQILWPYFLVCGQGQNRNFTAN
jgi:hypothetical protein